MASFNHAEVMNFAKLGKKNHCLTIISDKLNGARFYCGKGGIRHLQ